MDRLDTGRGHWVPSDKFKAIRLISKQPIDAVDCKTVAQIFTASHALYKTGEPFDNLISDDSARVSGLEAPPRDCDSAALSDAHPPGPPLARWGEEVLDYAWGRAVATALGWLTRGRTGLAVQPAISGLAGVANAARGVGKSCRLGGFSLGLNPWVCRSYPGEGLGETVRCRMERGSGVGLLARS